MATLIKSGARKLLAQGKASSIGYTNISYSGLTSKKHATVLIPATTDTQGGFYILRIGYDELDQWITSLERVRLMCIEESQKGN